MELDKIKEIVSYCKYNDWSIKVHLDDTRPYLQVHCENGVDNATGKTYSWSGRKWMLSYHMTETEIVKTALKAILAAQEHETLEQFKYHDISIFDPHISVADLLELRDYSPLDRRD